MNQSAFANVRISELRDQISIKNQEIQIIEEEIERYQNEISKTVEEGASLKNEIYKLQTTTNKLKAEIELTQKKIDSANYSIEKLEIEIENKNELIISKKNSLAEIIRKLHEEESSSLLEILLAYDDLSDFFNNIERMEYLQKDINVSLGELRELKKDLELGKSEKETEKKSLKSLNEKLGDQKSLADSNKQQKNSLLSETKNKEENFRKALDEKLAKKEEFLNEIFTLEAELQLEIDPGSIPSAGSGILKWPLDNISLESCWDGGGTAKNCITQFFGNTPFATKNPQVYGGKGHNGVDFRASVGTPVKTSFGGVVEGIGNTDAIKGCYSYGKWVLIKHPNGLSTLYAHLSLIKVTEGQEVKTGELIGYTGETGYATGPHLHYTVYASQGVQITKFTKSVNCKNAYVPIADPQAYLNPLSYL